MRVVIDSNIFIICLNPLSIYNIIFRKLMEGGYHLCVTTEIIFEYLEIFQNKFKKSKAELAYRYLHESNYVVDTTVFFKWNLINADPDDNKYVDCYVASNADYLVTNDRHFSVLAQTEFPPVKCIDIDEFTKLITE